VIAIDKVMDFAKHHCSNDIKLFLQVEENTKNKVGLYSRICMQRALLRGVFEGGHSTNTVESAGCPVAACIRCNGHSFSILNPPCSCINRMWPQLLTC
jgi:hypothetical protein